MNKPAATITDEEQKTKDLKAIETLKGFKTNFEPRWYIAHAFYEGKHFTYGKQDEKGNWITKTPRNKVIREIPKAKKQLQNIRNMVLKLNRKPVVYPDMSTIGMMDPIMGRMEEESALQQAKVIKYLWDEVLKVKRYMPKVVRLAQLDSHSFVQILNHGNGRYELEVIDAFDGSCYPTISSLKDHPKFAKHVPKSISELEEDESYDLAALAEIKEAMKDGKYSSSTYKQDLMVQKYGKADPETVIVDELYEIVLVPDPNQAQEAEVEGSAAHEAAPGDKAEDAAEGEMTEEKGGTEERELVERVRIVSYIHDKKVREQILPISKIPGAIYVWGDEAYETSLMEDMMPGNKSYDVLVSKLEAKAKKLDTGRIAIHKGEDTKLITTDDAEMIRWRRVKPEVLPESQLSSTFMEALNLLDGDLKEQGISVASGADVPSGVRAWRAIESLKESDYATLGVPMDNLDQFIVELTESLIEMVAYDTLDIQYARYQNENGENETVKYIGKRGEEIYRQLGMQLPSDVVVIDPNRTVKVEVESGLSWTETGKKELVLDLATTMGNMGLPLPPEVILDLMKVGNTQEIVEKIRYWQTYGQSMIDMPDFKSLPLELQKAIAVYLQQGANTGQSVEGMPAEMPAQPIQTPPAQVPAEGGSAPWKQSA